MQKTMRGFTLVELLVVLVIISILLTVGTLSYVSIQQNFRDDKRKADMQILVAALEKYYDKNGEYPRSGTGSGYNSSDLLINASTTLTQLQQGLDIKAEVKDPRDTLTTPFRDPTQYAPDGYRYTGGYYDYSASDPYYTVAHSDIYARYRTDFNLRCYGYMNSNREGSAFVLAYYNESERKTYLYFGRHGEKPAIDNNASCVTVSSY